MKIGERERLVTRLRQIGQTGRARRKPASDTGDASHAQMLFWKSASLTWSSYWRDFRTPCIESRSGRASRSPTSRPGSSRERSVRP